MNAIKMVNDMYNKLEAEYDFMNLVKTIKQHDFQEFCIVNCEEYNPIGPAEKFDLIVLETGTILNSNGDDVYHTIMDAIDKAGTIERFVVMCDHCGNTIDKWMPKDNKNAECPKCGKEVIINTVAMESPSDPWFEDVPTDVECGDPNNDWCNGDCTHCGVAFDKKEGE